MTVVDREVIEKRVKVAELLARVGVLDEENPLLPDGSGIACYVGREIDFEGLEEVAGQETAKRVRDWLASQNQKTPWSRKTEVAKTRAVQGTMGNRRNIRRGPGRWSR